MRAQRCSGYEHLLSCFITFGGPRIRERRPSLQGPTIGAWLRFPARGGRQGRLNVIGRGSSTRPALTWRSKVLASRIRASS